MLLETRPRGFPVSLGPAERQLGKAGYAQGRPWAGGVRSGRKPGARNTPQLLMCLQLLHRQWA